MRAIVVAVALFGLVTVGEQSMPLTYNQGIARIEGGWIVSGTNAPLKDTDVIARVDDNLNVVNQVRPAIPQQLRDEGYNHVGDIDVVGGIVYAPLEQPNYNLGQQVTARFTADTLSFIDAVTLAQHENSFVAVDDATLTVYSMDHFDGDALLRYDVRNHWTPLPPLELTKTLHHTQGADIADGAVWISTSDAQNGVYRVDIATGATTDAGTLGHVGAEGEGFDATPTSSGRFTGLVNDLTAGKVWVGHYDFSKDPSNRGVYLVAVGAALILVVIGAEWAWRRRRSRP